MNMFRALISNAMQDFCVPPYFRIIEMRECVRKRLLETLSTIILIVALLAPSRQWLIGANMLLALEKTGDVIQG